MPKKSPRGHQPEHGFVIEYNNSTGNVSFWEKDDNHSVADKNGVSTADYIHAMYGFLRQAKSKHVLMIGCGGGTLATMLRRVGVKSPSSISTRAITRSLTPTSICQKTWNAMSPMARLS